LTIATAESASFLHEVYKEVNRDLRVRQSKIGCILTLLLMPAGALLDKCVYPELVWSVLKVRLLADLGIAGLLALHYLPVGRRHIRVLNMAWLVLPVLSIAWMIYYSEGAGSPYYAGLTLVVTGCCVLFPWNFLESLLFCLMVLGLYIAASLAHRNGPMISGGSVFFLGTTAVICVTACFHASRRRFEEFCLRHELNIKNGALAQSYDRLSELDRLKSQFFANISHELRTPLTLILSPVEELLCRRDQLPAQSVEALEIVRQNALRLLKLITDILEIIRLEEGRSNLRRQPMNLSQFVPAMLDSVRHLAKAKGLTLNLQGADGLIVNGDPERLEKVILNILTNAIKFTPVGGSITTAWWQGDARAVVEFRDSGVGITSKDLPFIFDRFRQADGSSTRKYQGMGIGLALAKDLVREHDGSLTARSEVGKGTTLRLELPLTTERVSEPAEGTQARTDEDPIARMYYDADRTVNLATEQPPESLAPVASGKLSVLVVDDEPDMRRFLVSILAPDYRVLQAADGKSGLDMIRQHKPHLVLLDLMLPIMDGLDVCQTIKADEQTRSIKVILLTARTDEHSKIAALQRGADDFLTKPFSTTEVRTRLANLLQNARLEEDLRQQNVQLEQTLHRLKETEVQLVQSEKMNALGKLASGLLHEIHNPLNFTLMAIQVARQSVDGDAELTETLDDIGQGMNRIKDIISDLRAFAYPSSEKMQECFALDEAITTSLRLVSHETENIQITRHGTGGLIAVGSKTQVIQVLLNLVMNAAQALHAVRSIRQPQIAISAEIRLQRLQVCVRDNGTGVRAADLPRLFEPFFTTKEVGQGMGLGLSVCHTIVKNHGGTIVVHSQEGQWTEVSFDLPLDDRAIISSAGRASDKPACMSSSSEPGAT
jgi:signal transduction histidine kinase